MHVFFYIILRLIFNGYFFQDVSLDIFLPLMLPMSLRLIFCFFFCFVNLSQINLFHDSSYVQTLIKSGGEVHSLNLLAYFNIVDPDCWYLFFFSKANEEMIQKNKGKH